MVYILLRSSTATSQVYSDSCSGSSKEPQAVNGKLGSQVVESFRKIFLDRPNGPHGEGLPVL